MEHSCELSYNTASVIMSFPDCNRQEYKATEILSFLALDLSQGPACSLRFLKIKGPNETITISYMSTLFTEHLFWLTDRADEL